MFDSELSLLSVQQKSGTADRRTHGHTDIQIDKWTDGQTNRRTDRQTNRQTDRQTDENGKHISSYCRGHERRENVKIESRSTDSITTFGK